jgi:hypothetical protein
MAMGGADANLGIDSEIGVDAESRCRNSKWTKNSASATYTVPGTIQIWGGVYRTKNQKRGQKRVKQVT